MTSILLVQLNEFIAPLASRMCLMDDPLLYRVVRTARDPKKLYGMGPPGPNVASALRARNGVGNGSSMPTR